MARARRTKTTRELRVEAEVAEQRKKQAGNKEAAAEKAPRGRKKKAAAAPRARRTTKDKTLARRRLMWAVFSGALKEEARFQYHERELAEEKLEQLRAKSKKQMYFIQPIKVPIGDAVTISDVERDTDDEPMDTRGSGEEE